MSSYNIIFRDPSHVSFYTVRFHFLRLRSIALGGAVTATDGFARATKMHKLLNIYVLLRNALLMITPVPIDIFYCGKRWTVRIVDGFKY